VSRFTLYSSPLPLPSATADISPNLSLLSHFNLEEELNDFSDSSTSPNSPSPPLSLLVPEVPEVVLESQEAEPTSKIDVDLKSRESCHQRFDSSLKINNSEELLSGGLGKSSSWLTPTSLMIGFLAIFLILKSNSRSKE
jgi:hypothetical protein